MAFRVTAKLPQLKEPFTQLAPSPEEAAVIAWDFCQEHDLNIPNDTWYVQEWDAFAGEWEDEDCVSVMVRGLGTFEPKADFSTYVVSCLSKSSSNSELHRNIFEKVGMIYEPTTSAQFEMSRDENEKVTIAWDASARISTPDIIARKIDEALDRATDDDTISSIVAMLEDKLKDAKERLDGKQKQQHTD